MKKEYLTKRTLANYKYFDRHNSESTLFRNDERIIKLLKKEFLSREQTICRLDTIHNSDAVLPETVIYDSKGFLGYSMINYKEYKELEDFIIGKLPFNERKRICLELCRIIDDLERQEFAYYDVHPYNILYNNGDIKLIDMDSGIFKPDRICDKDYETYNTYMRVADYFLTRLSLALLFEDHLDQTIDNISSKRKELFNYSPKKLVTLYKYVLNKPYSFLDVGEYIEDIDEDYIESAKLILKK